MTMTTLYKDARCVWSVEEDSRGRLWLEVICDIDDIRSVHRPLTPGEARAFRREPESLSALVQNVLTLPKKYADKRIEADYRHQSGS